MTKTNPGNFFEDFRLGQEIAHATPRTLTSGDVALYTALYGNRFACNSADHFARSLGLRGSPVHDLLAFHIVFGKTVPDISLNAVANLGYADCRFGEPAFPGDTLRTVSKVIGLKENSNKQTGVVYVRSTGFNQRNEMVLDYVRWVMVRKKDVNAPAPTESVPELPAQVAPDALIIPRELKFDNYNTTLAGSPHLWEDYAEGETIDHVDGMTIEEAEHMLATRLYQNTAKVHFNQHTEKDGRFGRRLIYGGHIISIARSLSFNGLANAFKIVAINGGKHVSPTFAGDTIYAHTHVLEKIALPGRSDLGALRLRTLATKDKPGVVEPSDSSVVLDFDYTVLMPRKA
jgi:2-methylfumaryl-CoA hydratase